jgi:hypothetical protein
LIKHRIGHGYRTLENAPRIVTKIDNDSSEFRLLTAQALYGFSKISGCRVAERRDAKIAVTRVKPGARNAVYVDTCPLEYNID